MARHSTDSHSYQVDQATLQGVPELLKKWLEEGRSLNQQRWRALASKLAHNAIFLRLIADIGSEPQMIQKWAQGQHLPSNEVCAVFFEHLRKIIGAVNQAPDAMKQSDAHVTYCLAKRWCVSACRQESVLQPN